MASVAAAIAAARSVIGAPYVWGATGPNTFDCSGLMKWAWGKAGVTLPRTSQEQSRYGTAVALKDIRAGDLVTSNWGSGRASHVGMYIGSGKIIHAPRPGSKVKIANLDANYRAHVDAVRRVPGAKQAPGSGGGVLEAGWGDIPGLGLGGELLDLGGDAVDALQGSLLGPLKGIAAATGEMAAGLLHMGDLATWILRLALPSTWVRIAAGLFGAMFLFLGLGFLVRETRSA